MEKNSIKQLLMTSNFYVLNKQLVKSLGIETAFFLTALVEADEMLSDENGWFYQTVPQIEEITGLTKHKQNNSINELIALGILLQENKGMPMKRYFKLDYKKISDILFSSSQKNVHQGSKKLATKEEKNLPPREQKIVHHGGEKLATNKELNINNLDKKLNIKKVSSSTHDAHEEKEVKIETQPISVDKPKEELKAKIDEYKNLIAKATGEGIANIDLVLKPYVYIPHLDKLLEKIKASDYLSGRKQQKPSLRIFAYKTNEIIAGIYDDFEKTQPKEAPVNFNSNNPYDTRTQEQIDEDRKKQDEFLKAIGVM